MDKGTHVVSTSELGRVAITSNAVAQIVGHTAAESYGIVGMGGRGPLARLRRGRLTDGIDVRPRDGGLEVELHVVVEHGLNLAEVAATVRERVAYEVERHTGLKVHAVEVRVDDVRRS